ncbi:MAG: DUF1127 domain-containing protein [Rhodospirillales bacterium]
MSDFTLHTNKVFSHEGLFHHAREVFHTWQQRAQERHELTQLSSRDARDIGLTDSQLEFEANKPFWRA